MKTRLTHLATLLCFAATPVLAGSEHGHGGHGKFMSYFDSNNDGVVTMEEFKESSSTRFDNMDTNHDNSISAEEFGSYVVQRKEQRQQQRFASMDSNKDGQVSKEEFLNHAQQKAEDRFAGLDANSDGIISSEEFDVRPKGKHGHSDKHHQGHKMGHGFFNRLDTNHDGQVTRDESVAAWSEWFKRIDKNGDQVVSVEEVQNYRNSMHDK
jgi:hypothetical protein